MLDQGLTALVEDLHDRGLDKDVSVVVWGEFGRTPKINKDAGRDHWPQVACALLAGGGMKTGQVIGSTDRLGEHAEGPAGPLPGSLRHALPQPRHRPAAARPSRTCTAGRSTSWTRARADQGTRLALAFNFAFRLPHFQPRQRAGARGELVHLEAQSLEHRDVEVAQRRAGFGVEGQVLAVLEAAAGQKHRQVLDDWLLALPRLLLKNTIVRSSSVLPSSFVCFSLPKQVAQVFISPFRRS